MDFITVPIHNPFLQDAFSLLAYSDPWSSPMGWQLSAKERESVSAALNSAILESRQLPGKPPLEVALAHTKELIKGRTNGAFAIFLIHPTIIWPFTQLGTIHFTWVISII